MIFVCIISYEIMKEKQNLLENGLLRLGVDMCAGNEL